MVKMKTSANFYQLATVAIYVFLIAILGTYFLPIVSVNLPALGKKSWSVKDVVKTIPRGVSRQKREQKQLTPQYDFLDLVKEVSPRNPETKAPSRRSAQFILGALVPVALALTYLLALLSFFLAPLKKGAAFVFTSALTAICSSYALVGTFFLAQAAQRAFSSSLEKIADSPFSVIAKNFVREITIQPENGFLALVLLTVVVFGIGIYRRSLAAR